MVVPMMKHNGLPWSSLAVALVSSLLTGSCGSARRSPAVSSAASCPGGELRSGEHVEKLTFAGQQVTMETRAGADCRRRYTLHTTAELRDDLPANPRTVTERPDAPYVRSGSPLFDALYALAIEEAAENSVAEIRDGAFSDGEPLACPDGGCFETGRKWTYVWTRDTAYSVDLALAALDPVRAQNSLEFKLSEVRQGGQLQIVQDTGSGGSYPVSTDRVSWALGASRLLDHLNGHARQVFADKTYRALVNTLEADRLIAFDPVVGLYRGETSFLDWREQTYPPWTADDTVAVGESMALSTNVLHSLALDLAVSLAQERGESAQADRLSGYAESLRAAILEHLYLTDSRQYSTFIPGPLDPAPVRRFDLLGTSLAVLSGLGGDEVGRAAVASYPWLPEGPPVVWPQSSEVPIYHNRAIWPFVTAYAVRAARKVGNDAVVTRGVRSLVRGAAVNLSNMENFDVVTGKPWLEDGDHSGPVVNSQRQLWSVAGYLSMVHDVVFGIEVIGGAVRFRPYVTAELRKTLFAGTDRMVLIGFPYLGKRIDLIVELPAEQGSGAAYRVKEVRMGDRVLEDGMVTPAQLPDHATIHVTLEDDGQPSAPMTLLADADHQALYGPPTPNLRAVDAGSGSNVLRFAAAEGASVRVYRDGQVIAESVPATAGQFTDSKADPNASHCYVIEAYYPDSGNVSHRSRPLCSWAELSRSIAADKLEGSAKPNDGARRLEPGEDIVAEFRAEASGEHLIGLMASNGMGPINTGVTCALTRIEVTRKGGIVGNGFLFVPHTGKDAWDRFLLSNWLRVPLQKGETYLIRISADPGAGNMSALEHFERYTGGAGGKDGPENRARVRSVEIRWGLATRNP